MRYPEREDSSSGPFPPEGHRWQTNAARPSSPYPLRDPRSALTRPESSAAVARKSLPKRPVARTEAMGSPVQSGSLFRFAPCFVALVIGFFALKVSPVVKVGPYGLIQALSPLYYVAMLLLLVSFVLNLRAKRYRSVLLGSHLTILVLLLDGAPVIIEGAARFQTAWLHVGFVGSIANTGDLLPNFDARFNWPSFFEGVAMLDKVAGVSSAEVFLRWWPVALNLLYLPLIYGIAKEFLGSELRAWVATGLFPLANWVGQDYFSPQSLAYLLYLTFFFVLVVPLGARDRPAWQWLLRRGYEEPPRGLQARTGKSAPPPRRAGPRAIGFYLGVLVLLMAAMATGHQLTPIMAVVTALVLVVTGRTQVRGMVILFPLMAIGWICYGAVTFWSGHIGMMIGGLGNVDGNVGKTVVQRVSGSQAHEYVVDSRLAAAALVWCLSLVGAFVWRPRNENRAALPLVFLAAFAMVAGGNYGGEGMLRVYLFSLPGAVCLIAALISRLPQFTHSQVALGCTMLLLTPVFLIARWGNELYEMTLPGELTATNELYQIATPGSNLVSINSFVTWEYRDITQFHYRFVSLDTLGSSKEVLSKITRTVAGNPIGGYVIMTANQEAYGWQALGLPENWGTTVESMLAHSPNFKLRYSNPDGEVFQYVPQPVIEKKK
jgi:hypothetical protein